MTCAKNFKNWWMCVKATVSQTWELRHILGHSVHSSNEPGELSQRLWQHHLILIIGRIWQTVWPSDRSYLVQSVRSTPSRRVSGDGMLTQTYIMHPIMVLPLQPQHASQQSEATYDPYQITPAAEGRRCNMWTLYAFCWLWHTDFLSRRVAYAQATCRLFVHVGLD